MKSGLEDRNNIKKNDVGEGVLSVSMKSGLEDRNNAPFHVEGRPH